jgi:hypothetical protein
MNQQLRQLILSHSPATLALILLAILIALPLLTAALVLLGIGVTAAAMR